MAPLNATSEYETQSVQHDETVRPPVPPPERPTLRRELELRAIWQAVEKTGHLEPYTPLEHTVRPLVPWIPNDVLHWLQNQPEQVQGETPRRKYLQSQWIRERIYGRGLIQHYLCPISSYNPSTRSYCKRQLKRQSADIAW